MPHTIVVAKSWCAPARLPIQAAFQPLGIKARFGPVQLQPPIIGNVFQMPTHQTQNVTVSDAQAEWAEYVIGAVCRQHNYKVVSPLRNPKSFQNGYNRRTVPMPWAYEINGMPKVDTIANCVKSLPPNLQEQAMQDMQMATEAEKRSGGIAFGHHGRRPSERMAKPKGKQKRNSQYKRGGSFWDFLKG